MVFTQVSLLWQLAGHPVPAGGKKPKAPTLTGILPIPTLLYQRTGLDAPSAHIQPS